MINTLLSKYRPWIILATLFSLITLIFFSASFFLYGSLDIIYKAWDGPSYVVVAKSMYDPVLATKYNIIQSVDINENWTWLPAHFPGYPILIRLFSFLGYFQSMLLVSLLSALFATIALYEFIKTLKITSHPLWLTLPSLILHPRWFAVSHTGSSEPLFLALMLVSLTHFAKKNYKLSAIFATLSVFIRPQGVFLGIGYATVAFITLMRNRNLRNVIKNFAWYLLMPIAVLLVFTLYYFRTGDFFAYFPALTLFKHFQLSPFAVFSFPNVNVETYWQEINALLFALGFSACLMVLSRRVWWLGIISLAFFIPLIFMRHSDISRYMIPLLPVVFVAYQPILERKSFVLGVFLMAPAIMRYTLNFINFNRAP